MTHFHRTSRTTSLDWVRARDAVAAVDLADRVAHEEVIVETETFEVNETGE